MAYDVKLTWHELSPDMFPKEVQALGEKARKSRQQAAADTAAYDAAIQSFAPRIQVPNLTGNMVPLINVGYEMVISHRFGKLTVAATVKGKAKTAKTSAVLA